jgi:Asp-tRNA(Asn)/Glu-tRNA(Gln) amidotransferase A subunit family amidase
MQTIHEAAEAIRQRKITPIELVEQCLAAIDCWEEKVRAWVFVDRDGARAEAKRLTAELERGQYRGPLHGIPLGVKDIFDVFDWPTAAGSKLWAHSIARQDADVVRQLRQAGAIFLGKTVTTQYASFDPPVTRNPWNLDRTPGGSSSGSAAAVATGMCLGALGSQTGGSITRPASYCGVAGCKPSYGLVSCNGVVPLAPSMDHPGPIARCVADLAIMLQAMLDPTRELFKRAYKCDSDHPPSLVRPRGLFHDLAHNAVRKMMEDVVHRLRAGEAAIDDITLPPAFSEVLQRHRIVMAVEAAQFHELRLRRYPEDYQPCIRKLLEEGLACPAPEYARSKDHQSPLQTDLNQLLWDEVLLTPATTTPAPDAATTGDPAFNSPWSYTGLPTVSFPVGLAPDGLPLSIQLVGKRGSDESLLTVAAWCEKAIGVGTLTPPLPR